MESGYWHLYRYDPRLKEEGKNPFILDSKEPKEDYKDFILGEVGIPKYRILFQKLQKNYMKITKDAKERYNLYKALAELK